MFFVSWLFWPVATTTYDEANRLTQWGSTTLSYDAAGNLTGDGTNTYTWNARGQLASISGGASASFEYDGLGRRAARTVSSAVTRYLYDPVNVIQELDGSGPTANLLTGLGVDEIFSRADASTTSYFLTDALGSVLALTNGSGAIATSYGYGPYGETTRSGSSTTSRWQFAGREDDATSLIYMRSRYYSPTLQRFISDDPSGFGGGINMTAYAGNDPISLIDPFGLKPVNPPDEGSGLGPGGLGGDAGGGKGGGPGPVGGEGSAPAGQGPGQGGGIPYGSSGSGLKSGQAGKCTGSGGAPGAITASGIYDFGLGLGPAVSAAYVPSTGELFLGVGVGASVGHSYSVGTLLGSNPSAVLPEWSFGLGAQATPLLGAQAAHNSSGTLAGNTIGQTGVSASLTYSWCF